MAKKLSLLLAAVAVLAVAIPAMANAAVPLTENGGKTALAKGAEITGTSTNAKTKTGLGTLSCVKVVLLGKVTKNEGTTAEGEGTGEFTGTECSVEGSSVPVTEIKLINLKTTSPTGNGTASFSFKAKIGAVTCVFTGTNAPGTFSTTTMTNKLSISEATLSASPAACGPAKLSGDFFLTTTSNGAEVEIT